MMKRLLVLMLPALLFAATASSDPGANGLTRDAAVGSTNICGLMPGSVCYFAWGGGTYTGNSAVFNVVAHADFCLNTDTASEDDSTAEVTVYRVVNSDDKDGSIQPSAAATSVLTHSSGDCFAAVTGRYWLETTTDPTTTLVAVVSVTERNP